MAMPRVLSDLLQRVQLASLAGLQHGNARDLYKVFGYKRTITSRDIIEKYDRQDIVARIIDAHPKSTWSNPPEIKGNPAFNKAWKELARKQKIWPVLQRADRMAAIGRFSAVVLGFDDGMDTEMPVNRRRQGLSLLYTQVVGEHNTDVIKFETDARNPRFGKPLMYRVNFDDPATKQVVGSNIRAEQFVAKHFHADRMIHVVENPLLDESFVTPRVVRIFNLLDDMLKVGGGTAEAFWLTANRGLQADIDKEMELDEDDAAALSDELEEYQHQLRRVIRTRGVTLNNLGSETPDPKGVFEVIVSLLSGATGIPRRILIGSEQGTLASEQDRANWADRIEERRADFAQPYILEPLIDKLMEFGVLPESEYEVIWPDAFKMSPLERAQTMAQKGRSAANLSKQLGNLPIATQDESREFLGLEGSFPESEMPQPMEPQDPNAGPGGTGEASGAVGDSEDGGAQQDE